MLNEPAGNCSSTSAETLTHCTHIFAVSATTAGEGGGGGSNGVSGSMSNGEAKPIQGTNELISRQQAGVGVGVGEGVGVEAAAAAAGGDITCMIDCAVVQRIVAGAEQITRVLFTM